MIRVTCWRCDAYECPNRVFGLGHAHGLRAIGWEVIYVEAGRRPLVYCPFHARDEDLEEPVEKRLRRAHREALRIQRKFSTQDDRAMTRPRLPRSSALRKVEDI